MYAAERIANSARDRIFAEMEWDLIVLPRSAGR